MKEIPLRNKGMVALVDDEDYEMLAQFNWCAHKNSRRYYAVRNVRKNGVSRMIRMHTVIMGEPPEGMTIDHINPDATLDNRRENLRFATKAEQRWNQELTSQNTSGYMGAIAQTRQMKKGPTTRWMARIMVQGKNHFIGWYKTPQEAHAAYMEAAERLRGEKPRGKVKIFKRGARVCVTGRK